MNKNHENWTFDEYMSFILYHAAMADFNFADEEKAALLKIVNSDKLNEIRNIHKNNSDFENIQIILFFKEKFCKDDPDKILEVEAAIRNMFDSDGEYNLLERNMKRALDMLLKQ